MPVDPEKLKKLQQSAGARTGGKGTARRKKKVTTSTKTVSDDKRISQTLKKFQCNQLPGIDEVNMFKEDGTVIYFKNPKVSASPNYNTYTVSGHNDLKKITEIPGVLNQLGLEGLQGLQAWAKAQGLMDGANDKKEIEKQAKKLGMDKVPEGDFDKVEEDDVE